MKVGERLKLCRKAKGLTQKQLGELCNMSGAQIQSYELGRANPKIETLTRIANGLNLPVSLLLEEYYCPEPPEATEDDLWDWMIDYGDFPNKSHGLVAMAPDPRNNAFDDLVRCRGILGKLTPEAREIFMQRGEELTAIPKYQNKRAKKE